MSSDIAINDSPACICMYCIYNNLGLANCFVSKKPVGLKCQFTCNVNMYIVMSVFEL